MSVTDDYTKAERVLIRTWANKAKELSAKEPNTIWRVRGSPETQIYLKKFDIKQTRLPVNRYR